MMDYGSNEHAWQECMKNIRKKIPRKSSTWDLSLIARVRLVRTVYLEYNRYSDKYNCYNYTNVDTVMYKKCKEMIHDMRDRIESNKCAAKDLDYMHLATGTLVKYIKKEWDKRIILFFALQPYVGCSFLINHILSFLY